MKKYKQSNTENIVMLVLIIITAIILAVNVWVFLDLREVLARY